MAQMPYRLFRRRPPPAALPRDAGGVKAHLGRAQLLLRACGDAASEAGLRGRWDAARVKGLVAAAGPDDGVRRAAAAVEELLQAVVATRRADKLERLAAEEPAAGPKPIPRAIESGDAMGAPTGADAAGPVAAGGARAAPGRLARLRARRGFCACCKRPLHLSLAEAPAPKRARSGDRYAYVVALWGPSPEYLLGALALGWSLRRHGAAHDLVALHADDLPAGAVELLRRGGWAPHQVPHVEACGALFQEWTRNGRFAQVFTKIRVLGLVQYRKVLLLDADIIVNANIDDLFDLPAPAAMARGPRCGYAHGERIDGEFFFGGSQGDEWSWGQTGGINAGVMLLEPDEQTLAQCLLEITDPRHPEHVPGNGPEQDYLSRFWAGEWRHLDVSYNFQLHQMYFALSPLGLSSDRARFLDGTGPARIKAVHFSADPKPWARYLDPGYAGLADDAWLDEVRRKFKGYRAWVLQDPGGVQKGEQGQESRVSGAK
ncbi:unnamed protein product [Prorocentrum cordatum]|uniref:Hexosyltransferase n=1 Tax=Prorocentrum cordatum TaxID=2364126 RepID=A0ABN9XBQ7_9DINO|nr:unnamed protein product [Polarella glacialis]